MRWSGIALFALGLSLGCDEARPLDWSVELDGDDLRERATSVEVYIARGPCEQRGEEVFASHIDVGEDVTSGPPALDEGVYAFGARASSDACGLLAETCVTVRLPRDDEALSLLLAREGAADCTPDVDGGTRSCGTAGEPCCGEACEAGLRCTEGRCEEAGDECGAFEQACCDDTCAPGFECIEEACAVSIQCGGEGQACCDGVSCQGELECYGGACLAPRCGGEAEPCCEGRCLNALECVEDTCRTCGNESEPCCRGTDCTGALECFAETCQVCGQTGGPCCDGTCLGRNLCRPGGCVVCGGASQPCCATGAACDTYFTCISGTCTRGRV